MSTDAALLRARGAEITLGGQIYRLRYDFDALEQLETEYDGLDHFIDDLSSWARRFRAIRRGLVVGLASQLSSEEIGALLKQDTIPLPTYVEAINAALEEGLGIALNEESGDPKAKGSGDSPGDASTTSPLSVMDDQTPSSGE